MWKTFGNSLADSVSFRFLSHPRLDGFPLLQPSQRQSQKDVKIDTCDVAGYCRKAVQNQLCTLWNS
jgi:hypothetical protein